MSNLLPYYSRFSNDDGYVVVVACTVKKLMAAPFQAGLLVFQARFLRSAMQFGLISLVGLASFANPVYAETTHQSKSAKALELCLPDWIAEPLDVGNEKVGNDNVNSQQEAAKIQLDADRLTQPNSNLYEFSGSVVVNQPGTALLADKVQYQADPQRIDAFGHIELHRPDLIVTADEAHLNNKEQSAELLNVRYQMKPSRAHGHAQKITVDQQSNTANLKEATFTTCPIQTTLHQLASDDETSEPKTVTKEKVAWELVFDDVEINQNRRRVIGKNTTLKFHNVPIFYSPYFDFPLDNRASGLLFPKFGNFKGLNDKQAHFYYKQPYYFNLAPNYDDTLTTMWMDGRGLVLENEFRYLQKTGLVTHRGALTVTGLSDRETSKNGLAYIDNGNIVYGDPIKQRWRAKLIADQAWSPNLRSSVSWHESSDENFFADIPVESSYNSVTNIERSLQANYRKDNWHAYAQFLNYLPLRNAEANYEKRPEVGANYYKTLGNLRFDMAAETTQFVVSRHNNNQQLPEAQRTRLVPGLSYGINRSYGYLKANAIANHLNYSLEDNGYNVGDSSFSHTVMQYSLRGGLLFERGFELGGKQYIQTLEPEIQYLLIPYVNQARVPLFDTSAKSLDFSNLFALNRFSGYDRIGDTRQVTLALTSKILSPEGRPFLEAGIGQIRYLKDREVTLDNSATAMNEQSDYFVKFGLTAKKLYLSSTSQFSQETRDLVNANNRARWDYSETSRLLFNHTITDNRRPDEQETLALGATFKLNQRWQAGTYLNYDMTNKVRNQMTNAIRYDDCCWAGELSLEKTQLENGLYNYSVQFQIEFKGLSSGGNSFQDYLGSKLNF